MIEKIVIASGNPAKVDRYRKLFINIVGEVIGLKDFRITDKPKETGETAEENAEIKAMFYCARVGLPVFCEDEALYVDFLPVDQQPGVHVRRINRTDEVDDDKLLSHYEEIIVKTPENLRFGHWHVAYCLAKPDGNFRVIANDYSIKFFYPLSKVRLPGWPLSSIQGPASLNKPNAEMTEEDHQLLNRERDNNLAKAFNELFK